MLPVFVLLLIASSGVFAQAIRDLQPTVILISLDGFHPDYLEKYQPKTLNELAETGVRARWLIPAFPTKTFPNHYTIATGLYPDNHGIIENNMYDREFDAEFSLSNGEASRARWWGGEPIWVTAEKQGQRAASYFFPGTDAPIMGIKPTYQRDYNGRVPNEMRVDAVLKWLDLPKEKRPTMITLYFSLIDDTGHEFSPDAEELRYDVQNIDRIIKRLIDGLKARKIDRKANVIIISDHGMAAYKRRDAVILNDLFDEKLAERIFYVGEFAQIFPQPGKETEIYDALKSKLPADVKVYRKSELPARYKFGKHPRIAPLLVLPDEGKVIISRRDYDNAKRLGTLDRVRGGHGYDNQLESMRALFIARGAAFKNGLIIEPFENVEIYNVMAKILNLKPAANDGDLSRVSPMLK